MSEYDSDAIDKVTDARAKKSFEHSEIRIVRTQRANARRDKLSPPMLRANKKAGVGIAMQETKRAAKHIRLKNKERSGMTFRIMDDGAGIECRKMDILTAETEMSPLFILIAHIWSIRAWKPARKTRGHRTP